MKNIYILCLILIVSIMAKAQCPSVTVSPLASTLTCNGAEKTFTATYTNPNNNATITWYGPGMSLNGTSMTTGTIPSVFYADSPGTYTVMVINNTNSCSVAQTISVLASPVVPQMTVSSTFGYTLTCSQASLPMNISSNYSPTPISFTWTNLSTSTSSTSASSGAYTVTSPGYYVAEYLDGNFCAVSQTIEVLGTCTSVKDDDLKTNNVSFYPNPCNGNFKLNINFPSENVMFRMSDVLGRIVLEKKLLQTDSDFHLDSLSKGIYYCNIYKDERIICSSKVLIE